MADTIPDLPAELLRRAYRTPSGELAWRHPDAAQVIAALAAARYAILGGEAWVILPDGRLYGQIPQADGGPLGVYAWSVKRGWQPDMETWEEFCQRAAGESLATWRTMHVEADIIPELRPHVWLNITFSSRDDYDRNQMTVLPPEAFPTPD